LFDKDKVGLETYYIGCKTWDANV